MKDLVTDGGPALEHEAALVVLVPELDPLVGRFRLAHDPSAALGVPAHVTINYPFIPAMTGDPGVDRKLKALFAGAEPFTFSFDRIARLPHLLYLPPEPVEPFREIIELVAERFPDSPPYGGQHRTVIPHLTLADTDDDSVLEAVEAELALLLHPLFPIHSHANHIWLIDNSSGSWQHLAAFPLGAG